MKGSEAAFFEASHAGNGVGEQERQQPRASLHGPAGSGLAPAPDAAPPVAQEPVAHLRKREIERLWHAGLTTTTIATLVGCSQSYVSKLAQTLGLPPRGKGRQPADVAWSSDDDARLQELWASPMSRAEICRSLHRTYESVRSRARRLGLTRRTGAIMRGGKLVLMPRRQTSVLQRRRNTALVENSPCQFIAGEPSADDACKCGRPVAIGRAFCPEHLALVYVPPGSAEEQRAAKAIDKLASEVGV